MAAVVLSYDCAGNAGAVYCCDAHIVYIYAVMPTVLPPAVLTVLQERARIDWRRGLSVTANWAGRLMG